MTLYAVFCIQTIVNILIMVCFTNYLMNMASVYLGVSQHLQNKDMHGHG